MIRQVLYFSHLVMASLFVCMVASCSDGDDEIIDGTEIGEKEVEKTVKSALTEWGITSKDVLNGMHGYNLEFEQEDFLLFSNNQGSRFISYKFKNDSLCSTVIVTPQLDGDANLGNVLNEYSYVGELDNAKVYQNIKNNTLVCAYEVDKDTVKYQVIGFTPIISSLMTTLPAIIVYTGEVNVIKYNSATIEGSVTGVTSKVKVGIFYDTDKNLPTTTRKTKTTTSMGNYSFQITSLSEQTTYYYQMYAVVDNIYYYGDVKSFTTAADIN